MYITLSVAPINVTIGWKVARFSETQHNATKLNISVSRWSTATHFGCDGVGQCYIHCFWIFNGFPAVKEFWKSVNVWRSYRHKSVAHFSRLSVLSFLGHMCDEGVTWPPFWNFGTSSTYRERLKLETSNWHADWIPGVLTKEMQN